MPKFVSQLATRRGVGETDSTFAARLGLSRGHWARLKSGKRPVTVEIARRAIALWPDLEPIYMEEVQARLHSEDAA